MFGCPPSWKWNSDIFSTAHTGVTSRFLVPYHLFVSSQEKHKIIFLIQCIHPLICPRKSTERSFLLKRPNPSGACCCTTCEQSNPIFFPVRKQTNWCSRFIPVHSAVHRWPNQTTNKVVSWAHHAGEGAGGGCRGRIRSIWPRRQPRVHVHYVTRISALNDGCSHEPRSAGVGAGNRRGSLRWQQENKGMRWQSSRQDEDEAVRLVSKRFRSLWGRKRARLWVEFRSGSWNSGRIPGLISTPLQTSEFGSEFWNSNFLAQFWTSKQGVSEM
jgi:hypothetical protein